MWHLPPHKSAPGVFASAAAKPPSAVEPSVLSEDVERLLTWGRHALQAQRQQRRAPSTSLAFADQASMARRTSPLSSSAVPVSTPVAPDTDECTWRLPAQGLNASARIPELLRTNVDAPYTVEEARKRLAQLKELEVANTRMFESRWALLCLGRERLLRLHRKRHEGEAPSPRTHHLRRLTITVQAIVEGEASLKEALRDILRGLAELGQRLEQHHRQAQEDVVPSASARQQNGALSESVHAGSSGGSEEDAEAKKGASTSLRSLADDVVRGKRLLLDSHREWQTVRAAQRRTTAARLQQRAESERALQYQLEKLKAAVAEVTAEEAYERRRLAALRAQCAAAEREAALQNASALRERATSEALQRLQQLHQHAAFQEAIECQELAASEARYHQAKATYDVAVSEHHAAQEALAAAQQACVDSKRRREGAEGDLARVRQALKSVSDKCEEVRAQRAQTAEDCAAADDALYQKQRAHDSWLSGEKGDGSSSGGPTHPCLGAPSAANGAAERYRALQQELPRLERHLERGVEEVLALERTEAQLRGTLERKRCALGLLSEQKTALEAHLASLESGVGDALGVVAQEKAGSREPAAS
ncbi:hypothetical protein, unknown function [Leishmania tarentolae]|uniref:Uncharacterized protein n=1 Tax=Leishmania tarentolae TaxID=5689 RepID=A0A640KC13_LEITA|nr:hypothetical protein, unknown function [Leishmania tarentolae]